MGDGRSVFTLDFGAGRQALAARVSDRDSLEAAVRDFGLTGPRPTVAIVGGAGRMTETDIERTSAVVALALLPTFAATRAVVVDGGTDVGVMRLMGRARDTFPLVGVAVEQTVVLPGRSAGPGDPAPLESHHSHFVLVPGTEWGEEAPWLADTATVVAGSAPSATVLINGGAISADDAAESLRSHRPVLVLAGTGRLADRIQAARNGARDDDQITHLAEHPLVHVADVSDPTAVRHLLTALLRPGG